MEEQLDRNRQHATGSNTRLSCCTKNIADWESGPPFR